MNCSNNLDAAHPERLVKGRPHPADLGFRAIATESGMSAVFAGAVSVTEEENGSKSFAACGAPDHRLMFTRPATTTLRKVQ
jgi:hypothetical protein